MIQFDLVGRQVLDAFAGSGQMGLEALSRGASKALLVDKNKAACDIVKKNIELTRMSDKAEAVCGDISDVLKRRAGREVYDIVFLDPPYRSELIKIALACLTEYKMLSENAKVICESGEPVEKLLPPELLEKFTVVKAARYGIAHITVLKLAKEISVKERFSWRGARCSRYRNSN